MKSTLNKSKNSFCVTRPKLATKQITSKTKIKIKVNVHPNYATFMIFVYLFLLNNLAWFVSAMNRWSQLFIILLNIPVGTKY